MELGPVAATGDGIRGRLQTLERAVYPNAARAGSRNGRGSTSSSPEAHRRHLGQLVRVGFQMLRPAQRRRVLRQRSRRQYDQYLAPDKPEDRKALAEEIQRGILDNYYFVTVFRHAFVNAIGPRIKAAKWQDAAHVWMPP